MNEKDAIAQLTYLAERLLDARLYVNRGRSEAITVIFSKHERNRALAALAHALRRYARITT
jgi:hypothetical protein